MKCHVIPEYSRNFLQLLDPSLPVPKSDMEEGEEGFSWRFPSATCVPAAEQVQHAAGPPCFTQQSWALETTLHAFVKPAEKQCLLNSGFGDIKGWYHVICSLLTLWFCLGLRTQWVPFKPALWV